MRILNKSFKWIFMLALMANLFSFAGFVRTSEVPRGITTEILVIDSSSSTHVATINDCSKLPLQPESSLILLTFDFNHFLNIYNSSCKVKLRTQNVSIDNSINRSSIRNLISFLYVKINDSDNIFIS